MKAPDDELPLPPPSPREPSRLRRTLHSLRSPFRAGSPFHLAPLHRSAKSSGSDGDIARDGRTMRKRNKKNRDPASAAASDASHSTDSSPSVDKKKKDGFIRRMGSIGKKRAEEFTSAPSLQPDTKESSLEVDPVPLPEPEPVVVPLKSPSPGESTGISTPADTPTETPGETPTPDSSIPGLTAPEPASPPDPVEPAAPPPPSEPAVPEPVSPIAVHHPIAIHPFAKASWTRKSELVMQRPVEEPSPECALRRRVAFVAQASASPSSDAEDGERGASAVGSLEEAVALARVRLAASAPCEPHSRRDADEEGCHMPAYGDLIEPAPGPGPGSEPSHASPSAERREHLYKILVIGELGTGKTSIIKRYVHQFFSQHYRATIGVDFALKVLNWDANTVIRLQLWDIAGQERFGNMTRVYYKEAVGAFIVFDVSRVATFDAVVKWKNDLDSKVQLPDGSPIPCILLANKCDQQKDGIVSSPAKMEEYCREKGFAGWFETSAKENINIEEAARSLVNKILLNDKLLQSSDSRDGDRFALEHKIANGENNRDSSGKSCSC